MRAGSMGPGMEPGMGLTPPARPAGGPPAPYLAWEVSQQLLETRPLCQRGGGQCSPHRLHCEHLSGQHRLHCEPRSGRNLQLCRLGTWYSTVPSPHGVGNPGVMALGTFSGWHSWPITPQEQGRQQTGHRTL